MYDPTSMTKLAQTIHEERVQSLTAAYLQGSGPSLRERLSTLAGRLTAQFEAHPEREERPAHITQEIPAAR